MVECILNKKNRSYPVTLDYVRVGEKPHVNYLIAKTNRISCQSLYAYVVCVTIMKYLKKPKASNQRNQNGFKLHAQADVRLQAKSDTDRYIYSIARQMER